MEAAIRPIEDRRLTSTAASGEYHPWTNKGLRPCSKTGRRTELERSACSQARVNPTGSPQHSVPVLRSSGNTEKW